MHFINPMVATELQDVPQGALVLFDETEDVGAHAIGLQLGSNGRGAWNVAILRSGNDRPPYLATLFGDACCLVIGTEWAMEFALQSVPVSHSQDAGTILFYETVPHLRIHNSGQAGMHPDNLVNLQTCSLNTPTSFGKRRCINAWRIWESQDRVHLPNVVPLVEFKGPK